MEYLEFLKLTEKPTGKTCPQAPVNGTQGLDFSGVELSVLDDFSSFEDLMSDLGIESWEEDFRRVFPKLEPLACAAKPGDSYTEFLLLVDTGREGFPVYWFSAEWWDWDGWENDKDGFELISESFAAFYDSLTPFEAG